MAVRRSSRTRPVLAVDEDERRPGRAREHGRRVEGDPQVQLGAAAGHGEALRRARARALDEVSAEARALAVHAGAVPLEKLERVGVEYGAADLIEQSEGCFVDLAATAVVEHVLHGWFGHDDSSGWGGGRGAGVLQPAHVRRHGVHEAVGACVEAGPRRYLRLAASLGGEAQVEGLDVGPAQVDEFHESAPGAAAGREKRPAAGRWPSGRRPARSLR